MEGEVTMAKSKTIGGFDKWEVESAARTLMEAEQIKTRGKFFTVVKKECDKLAAAAHRAALEKRVAAKLINLQKKSRE